MAGLAVFLVGVMLTAVLYWSVIAASSSPVNVVGNDWQIFAITGGLAVVGVALMTAGAN